MGGSRVAVALTVVCIAATGCVNTTGGTARPADTLGRTTTSSSGSPTRTSGAPSGRLDDVLLGVSDINAVMGSSDLDIVDSSDEMSDNASDVSDQGCLGALYNAEDAVYDGSGWTDVRDEVLTEPEGDSDHWVEQTVVQFGSSQSARAFYDKSLDQWQKCIGKDVTVDDGGDEYHWRFGGLTIKGTTMSQTATQTNSDGWACQHALGAVSDVIVETAACKLDLADEAVEIAEQIAGHVS